MIISNEGPTKPIEETVYDENNTESSVILGRPVGDRNVGKLVL